MAGHEKLNTLLLAGSRHGETDTIARNAGVRCKALAPVAGRPMIARVLGVLRRHPGIGRIDVALEERAYTDAMQVPGLSELLADDRVQRMDPRLSPARTVAHALSNVRDGDYLLITTADHALLDARMLDRFLAGCDDDGVDAFAGLLPLELLEQKYPGMRRTGLRFRDGRYSGCNLFLIRGGPGARSLMAFWQRLESLRKSPWRMAFTVGPATLIQYGLRRLTLCRALRLIGDRCGARLAPAMLDIPEAAIDVDRPEDLAFVENLLR